MPERIQQMINKIVEWWKNFNTKQRALIISIAAVVAVAFAILGYVVTRPTIVPLVTCTTAEEASKVKELLEGENISYEVSDDGMSYSVNKENQAQASILLGTNDIPTKGYSLSDAIDGSFSTTEADKQKKYQLYLEEKFADDLSNISNVSSAKVTLSLPKDDGTIISKKEEAYASIILKLSAEMDEEQAAGIASYMATQLGNDSTKNILILDGDGNVLFSGGDEASTAGKASSNLTAKQKAESYVSSAVKNVVPPDGKILKLFCKEATTISNFCASTVDIENNKTKKQSNKFIRSLKVAIHAGEPFGASSCFFLATMLHLHLPQRLYYAEKVPRRTSTFPQ